MQHTHRKSQNTLSPIKLTISSSIKPLYHWAGYLFSSLLIREQITWLSCSDQSNSASTSNPNFWIFFSFSFKYFRSVSYFSIWYVRFCFSILHCVSLMQDPAESSNQTVKNSYSIDVYCPAGVFFFFWRLLVYYIGIFGL